MAGAKGDSETVNKQIEEKRRKNSALHDARVDPRRRDGATKTYLGQGTTQEICKEVPKRRTRVASTQQESTAFLMSMNATKVCS